LRAIAGRREERLMRRKIDEKQKLNDLKSNAPSQALCLTQGVISEFAEHLPALGIHAALRVCSANTAAHTLDDLQTGFVVDTLLRNRDA